MVSSTGPGCCRTAGWPHTLCLLGWWARAPTLGDGQAAGCADGGGCRAAGGQCVGSQGTAVRSVSKGCAGLQVSGFGNGTPLLLLGGVEVEPWGCSACTVQTTLPKVRACLGNHWKAGPHFVYFWCMIACSCKTFKTPFPFVY